MSVFDPTTDYEVFDGTEAITLRTQAGYTVGVGGKRTTYGAEYGVTNALRRAVTEREVVSFGGALKIDDARWELPKDQLPAGIIPAENNEVTQADGTTWRIMYVDRATLGTRYRCYGRRP